MCINRICLCNNIDDNTNTNDQIIVNDAKISNELVAKDSAGDLAANSAKQEEKPKKLSKVSKNNEEDFMDIIDATYRYKKWVEQNKKLPSTVKVGNTQYSHEDFTYLMARTIQNINKVI